mgnify:CR=1 FL=1
MLSPYRVLDLTGEQGQACGKLFADLGAAVEEIRHVDPRRFAFDLPAHAADTAFLVQLCQVMRSRFGH